MMKIKKYKVARRLGAPIFEKCLNPKFSLQKTVKGKGGRQKMSDYATQLLEKQKVRFYYGVSERQFKNAVVEAMETAHPARRLFELLELRLDSAVYRLGFASTRRFARQIASHGHLVVNGRKVSIPSYRLSVSDTIGFRPGSNSSKIYTDAQEKVKTAHNPGWMKCDTVAMIGTVTGVPINPDPMLDFQSVIEFYSR